MRKNSYTEELSNSDNDVDRAFIGFKTVVVANTYNLSDDTVKNAHKINDLISAEGRDMHRENYQSQIAKMSSLKSNLQKPEYIALAADLGITTQVNDFITAFDRFAILFNSSMEESSVISNLQKTSVYRKELFDLYNGQLVSYINRFAEKGKYDDLIIKINEHVDRLNEICKARATRKEKTTQAAE